MTGEEIAIALGNLPDDLIEGALKSGKQVNRLSRRIAQTAACLSVIVTAVCFIIWLSMLSPNIVEATGILDVTASSLDGKSSIKMEEGISLPWAYEWSLAVSSQIGIPLSFSIPNEYYPGCDISFVVSVGDGSYQTWNHTPGTPPTVINLGQHFVVDNPITIYWWNVVTDHNGSIDSEKKHIPFFEDTAYTDIIIKADNHIVGYAVIKIYKTAPDTLNYCAVIEKSVSFPLIEGTYQEINPQFIAEEIAKIHN